jgi:hypothetical protein
MRVDFIIRCEGSALSAESLTNRSYDGLDKR